MGSFFIGFLIGLVGGAVGIFFLTRKDSKKIKAEKAQIIYESEKQISELQKWAHMAQTALTEAQDRINKLTVEEANLKISLQAQEEIIKSSAKVVSDTTSSILDDIKKRAISVQEIQP